MSANDKAAATWHPHDRPAPGVYRPGQTQPRDVGDGLRARVEELERRLAEIREPLRRVLAARGSGHCHSVPGIWDWDNGAKAGTTCTHCIDFATVSAFARGDQ